MKEGWKIYQFGELVTFDKRFKGIDRTKQKNIVTFNHVSAELLKSLPVDGGDVKLLATGLFDGYTTKEKAGSNLNNGEVITIPTGGNANIKYYKGSFVDSGNILAVSSRADIYLRYIWYYLVYQNVYLESCFKGTGIKHPFMPDIWNIEVPVPSLSAQERIVSYLDAQFAKIDALKANIEQQLQASKDFFQSALKEFLTPKDGWEKKSLTELCESISAGGDAPKDHMSEEMTEQYKYPIYSNGVESEGLYGYTDDYKIDKPAITIAARGTIGATFIRKIPFTPIVRLITLIPNDSINIAFLYYLIKSLNIGHTGSSIPQLTVPMVKELEFYIPYAFKEQREIVAILDSLSDKVKALQENYNKALVLCNDLKQSLLKSIFE